MTYDYNFPDSSSSSETNQINSLERVRESLGEEPVDQFKCAGLLEDDEGIPFLSYVTEGNGTCEISHLHGDVIVEIGYGDDEVVFEFHESQMSTVRRVMKTYLLGRHDLEY